MHTGHPTTDLNTSVFDLVAEPHQDGDGLHRADWQRLPNWGSDRIDCDLAADPKAHCLALAAH